MAKIVILEGARGAGKTTIARILRSKLKSSTLINMTGYPEDGEEGKAKIYAYYDAFLKYISLLDNSHTFILDRMFITEMVFSKLYKSYDFTKLFDELLLSLQSGNHEIYVFWLCVDEDDIAERLKRDKTDHFSFADTEREIMRQQDTYYEVFNRMLYFNKFFDDRNRFFHVLNTSKRSIDEAVQFIKDKLQIL